MEHWLVCVQKPIGGRDEHAAGQALIRQLLMSEGLHPGWPIETDDGKPFLPRRPDQPAPPAISIAHSAGRAAAALSWVGPVGLDLEMHNSTRNWAGIADTYFGPREAAQARAGGVRAFYRIWSVREAMGKATGEGLLTDQTDLVADTPHDGAWVSGDGKWLLAHVEPITGFSLALAVLPGSAIDPRRWSLQAIRWPIRDHGPHD